MDIFEDLEEIVMTRLTNQLMSAYRKYKSFIYYDSYSSIQRIELSNFERNPKIFDEEYEIDDFFSELAKIIIDPEEFDLLGDFICDNINVISFPKRVMESDVKTKYVIRNFDLKNFNMDRLHYFIDLPIIGHIIGVLWILRCGYLLDDKLYNNCYGNRLNKHLLENLKDKNSNYYVDDDCSDFTNFLFMPYFQNYQSWRDNGLNSVNDLLDNHKNAIMISMDLKEYFYRSLIDFKALNKDIIDTRNYFNEQKGYSIEEYDVIIDDKLTKFIEKVFNSYSKKFNRKYYTKTLNNKKIDTDKYPMLPVGFLPSLIISNWNLQGFDQAIVENLMPHYYGRYVDDILIVLGSHEKSETHGLQQIEQESLDELFERYMTDKKPPKTHIFKKDDKWDKEKIYRIINQSFKNSNNNKITYHYEGLEIQDSKLKTYFFSYKYSNAIIENFKNHIRKNSKEFQLMHDLESIRQEFRENLYKINYKESINKIRDIDNVDINKFEISRILSLINLNTADTTDNIDDDLVNDMVDAFKGQIFDYLTLWDRLFTMLLINDKYDQLTDLIRYIQSNIGNISYTPINQNSYEMSIKDLKDEDVVRNSLMRNLYCTLSRVFALKYNFKVKRVIENIKNDFKGNFSNQISNCLNATMQYTSLMKYPLQDVSGIVDNFDDTTYFNLINPKNKYKSFYDGFCYPRFIKLHECILHSINNEIFNSGMIKLNSKANMDYLEESFELYHDVNFKNEGNLYENYIKSNCNLNCIFDDYCPLIMNIENKFKDVNVIKIKGERKNKIKVGLLNTTIDFDDFEKTILGKPNLTSKRFDKIKLLINEAIKKNVDLLVMPEMYIPYDWIEKIVRISKDHQMAIIFSTEPINLKNKIGNYIMMALPFVYEEKYLECALMYRPKNHYCPDEIRQFEKYELKINEENNPISKYFMCIWNDIHIVPYSSYEIASIEDRCIFKSCCDIVTVSQLGEDTGFTDDILEVLSRDLFCYCIKSNASNLGGSSIIQPTSSKDKYLINLKGGIDDCILTHDLDIDELRKHAIKSDKFADSSNFQPKTPGFCKNTVKERFR